MQKVKVRMNVSIASSTWSYRPGQEVDLPLDLAEKWKTIGHCTIIGEPYEDETSTNDNNKEQVPLTLEEFAELKADEQKALLKKLGIEGDDSNEEKRVALYTSYLAGGQDGAEANNSPNDGAGNAGGSEGVSQT